jgi:hypothetical protein
MDIDLDGFSFLSPGKQERGKSIFRRIMRCAAMSDNLQLNAGSKLEIGKV